MVAAACVRAAIVRWDPVGLAQRNARMGPTRQTRTKSGRGGKFVRWSMEPPAKRNGTPTDPAWPRYFGGPSALTARARRDAGCDLLPADVASTSAAVLPQCSHFE